MFEFIRPDLRARAYKWRECLIGALVACLAAYFWLSGGLLAYLAPFVALASVCLLWLGIQRARFRQSGSGIGTVQVLEGQITYYGPHDGGSVSVVELERLTLDGTAFPAHWRLDQTGQPELLIPLDAHGADALFDAFAMLPDIKIERMLTEMEKPEKRAVVIWERAPLRPAGVRLH